MPTKNQFGSERIEMGSGARLPIFSSNGGYRSRVMASLVTYMEGDETGRVERKPLRTRHSRVPGASLFWRGERIIAAFGSTLENLRDVVVVCVQAD